MTDTKAKVPAAPVPGSPDFDVDNAPQEEYDKHLAILKRRADVAALTPTVLTAEVVSPGTPVISAPDDVHAVNEAGESRTFSKITWDAMETKGEHDGWQVAVDKPADLPKA